MTTAIVTGAAGGLGTAIARRLAADGARILLVDREPLDELAGELDAEAFAIDLTEDDAPGRVIAAAGDADVLVNNAGITRFGRVQDYAPSDWDDVMAVNVRAPFLLSQAFGRSLLERGEGGAIVNIGSIGGRTANPQNIPYGVSKSSILGLTQQLAVEWGPFGIRVNAVNPGLTTWHMQGLEPDLDVKEQQRRIVPLRRLVEPADIAAAVAFLASPEARCITGVLLDVDCGYLLSLMSQLPRPERFL